MSQQQYHMLPDIPDTNKRLILIVKEEKHKALSSISANEFDAMPGSTGKGLLNMHHVSM